MNAVYSELHERLNQMVNYSSQLIFVSSDTIAAQRKTLESFLACQDEHTEVAFITANADSNIVQYRRQLCQQLLGQVAGSFIRPLNELLESLNHHDGPVLIGIMQAQMLPNAFLQELWELVLQSRFAANKQHLNIVLFGETAWAEQAQNWLPAKNTATPLLLSSEVVSGETSELDALIAQKRAAFHQRLALRQQSQAPIETKVSPFRKPWFTLLLVACFVVTFGGLLWWQYPEKVAALFGIENIAENATSTSVPGQLAGTQLANNEVLQLSANPQETAETLVETSVETSIETTGPYAVDTSQVTERESESVVETKPRVTSELLVSQWKTSNAATQSSNALSESENLTLSDGNAPQQSMDSLSATVPTALDDISKEQSENSQVVSMPTQSINSIEGPIQTANPTQSEQAVANVAQPEVNTQPPAQPISTTREQDVIWLPEGLGNGYVIQLTGVSSLGLAKQFILDNALTQDVWIYQSTLNSYPWYVIVANDIFNDIDSARAAIATLPQYNQISTPFVKSIRQIERERNPADL